MRIFAVQTDAGVEWHQVWFTLPGWLVFALIALCAFWLCALLACMLFRGRQFGRIAAKITPVLTVITAPAIVVLSIAGIANLDTKESNLQNLYRGYFLNEIHASENFLLYGDDFTAMDYTTAYNRKVNVTFRVVVEEHDGVLRGRLYAVRPGGSKVEIHRKFANPIEEGKVVGSNRKAKSSGSGKLQIRDKEVREYLNDITQSEGIKKELKRINERLDDISQSESIKEELKRVNERLDKITGE